MMKKITIVLIAFMTLPLTVRGQERDKRWQLELETGPVWNSYNQIAIPGDTGSRFSLPDSLDIKPRLAYRLRLGYQISRRHGLSLLYAPLSLDADGRLPAKIYFIDRHFDSGSELKASYRFNSYRLSYIYSWVDTPSILFRIGFTAKVRDAEIALQDAAGRSAKSNVGFVPLVHLAFHWRFDPKWRLIADLDALAAKQGRAEDLFLGIAWQAGRDLSVKLGYRMVEGGADNEEVYNFAWLHYLAAGLSLRF